ncbi:hypothetical protein [Microbispora sp. NPDC046933]|uniref:hypothetical protein n=1 Tax=Microbispora sp. NPDC046933 TaxID=3155618 RepID=UPI0033C75E5D
MLRTLVPAIVGFTAAPGPTWLVALNAATLAVLYGVAAGPWPVAAAGAAAVVGVVVWNATVLAGMLERALPGPFRHVIGWYLAAAGALAVGGTLGGLLAAHVANGPMHERLHAAHAETNLFGWVAMTVLGTLFTLWPTVLRTRVSPLTRRSSRLALRLAVAGLGLTLPGLLLGSRWVVVAGLAVYLVAVAVALTPWRRRCGGAARNSTAPPPVTTTLPSRPGPANGCASGWSRPVPGREPPSTWSGCRSTPSTRKAHICSREANRGAPRCWTWPRPRAASPSWSFPNPGTTPSSTTPCRAPRPAPTESSR